MCETINQSSELEVINDVIDELELLLLGGVDSPTVAAELEGLQLRKLDLLKNKEVQ